MNDGSLSRKIRAARERLAQMRLAATASPGQRAQPLEGVLEDLDETLEMLRVAEQGQRERNLQLAQALQAMEAERQRYQKLFELAPDGYLVTDAQGTIREANRAAAELLNVAPRFLVGKPLAVFFSESERRAFRGRLNHLLREPNTQEWEVQVTPRDRAPFRAWLTVTVAAEREKAGTLRWLMRDVTERRVAEERLRDMTAELEQRVAERTAQLRASNAVKDELLRRTREARDEAEAERARLQAILQSTSQGIVFVDAETLRLLLNRAARQLLGLPAVAEARPSQLAERLHHPSGRRVAVDDLPLIRSLRTEAVQHEECVVALPGGRRVPVAVSASAVRDATGKVRGAVMLLQDVSALKELERLREEWVSVIAHDLRQPVTIIGGYAGLLARLAGRQTDTKERTAIEHILSSARQLNRMISDLLDVSRLETRQMQLTRIQVDLPRLVREVVERSAEVATGHRVRVEVEEDVPPVQADAGRIEQVLVNLLSNAAKYSYPDTDISIMVAWRGEEVEVAVSNRGEGIAPEELPRLFSRYFRTGRGRAEAGVGLGLSICKGLVEAHGGRIWAESRPREITTFHFTLPTEARAPS